MAKKDSPPMVEVHWLDAVVDTGQYSRQDAVKEVVAAKRRTVGYFVHEDEGDAPDAGLWLAQDYDAPDHFATISFIPKGWITKRKTVTGKAPSGFGRKAVRRTRK